jgi:hypothetical protein
MAAKWAVSMAGQWEQRRAELSVMTKVARSAAVWANCSAVRSVARSAVPKAVPRA